jgi:hypothetical protein
LMERDAAVERWLREDVVAGHQEWSDNRTLDTPFLHPLDYRWPGVQSGPSKEPRRLAGAIGRLQNIP